MISWLIEQSIILSFLIGALLLIGKSCQSLLGAKNLYKLWGTIPFSLLLSLLPEFSLTNEQVNIWVVSLAQNSQELSHQLSRQSFFPLLIWSAGVLILLGYYVYLHKSYIRQLQLKSSQLHGVKLNVYRSDHCQTPFISGLLKPYLVLPANFEKKFSSQQQQLILQHELNHYQQGDLYWNALAQWIALVFWFNPFVWLGFKYFRQAQELACDQSVLQNQDQETRIAYAKAMLSCAEQQLKTTKVILNYGDKADMKVRLIQLKQHKKHKVWKLITSISLCFFTVLSVQAGLTHSSKSREPKPIMRIEPVYPVQAAKSGVEGSVVLEFDIEQDGSTSGIKVVQASPQGVFGDSAIAAMQQWRWEASSQKSENMLVQLDFILGEKQSKPRLKAAEGENEQIIVSN